jgi:hypothetical protein
MLLRRIQEVNWMDIAICGDSTDCSHSYNDLYAAYIFINGGKKI